MTHDTRTADDIERDIASDRSQMSSTLDDLQKKFSVDHIVDDLGHMVHDLRDDVGRIVSRTVRRNPAAMVLVGAGLAWLVLGGSRNPSDSPAGQRSGRGSGSHRGYGQSGSDNLPTDLGFDDGAWFDNGGHGQRTRSHGNAKGVTNMLERAKGAADDAADSVSHAASDLSDRLSRGLEDLSDEAKARVVAARRAAHDARDASEAAMHRGADAAAGFFKDQPLVVGALAMAFGAAIGSILPHSRLEDDTMGKSSDRLFNDAQAVFRKERDNAMAALKGAASGAKDEIDSIGSDLKSKATDALPEDKSLGEAVVDRASGATKRVYGKAKDDYDEKGSNSNNS